MTTPPRFSFMVRDKVAEALANTVDDWYELPEDQKDFYRNQAVAALEVIALHNQSAAPGDQWSCPACPAQWEAISAGPLDIAWKRADNQEES